MALKLKLPTLKSLGGAKLKGADSIVSKPLPLIGHLATGQQLKFLGISALICLLLTLIAAYVNNRETSHSARYVERAGELQILFLRLANSSQAAMSGDSEAFERLAQNRDAITKVINQLDKGDFGLPATTGGARKELEAIKSSVDKTVTDVTTLEQGRPGLVTLAKSIEVINITSAEMRPLVQEMTEAYTGPQKTAAATLGMSIERIGKDAATMLSADVSLEQLAQLGVDTYAAEDALNSLPSGDPLIQKATNLFEPYRNSIEILVSQSRNLVEAKGAARAISNDLTTLSGQSEELTSAYQSSLTNRLSATVAVLAGVLTVLLLLLIFKEYLNDSNRRAAAAEA